MANRKLYIICISAFLIIWGLLAITNITVVFSGVVLGLLAIAGGILWLLDR